MEVDVNQVTKRLGQRIAELEIENAVLKEQVIVLDNALRKEEDE